MVQPRSIVESNRLLANVIALNQPFIMSRPGIGGDSFVPYHYTRNKTVHPSHLHMLQNNAGIYFRDDSLSSVEDRNELKEYCQLVTECWKKSALVACFPNVSSLTPIYRSFSPA